MTEDRTFISDPPSETELKIYSLGYDDAKAELESLLKSKEALLDKAVEVLEDIKLIVHRTEELNMSNYDEGLVEDMNNSFIAISEALAEIKEKR